MAQVKVSYDHRVDGTELVHHEKVVSSHNELCKLIDNYPWDSELELTEKTGVGGGFFFLLGEFNNRYAYYQFTPIDTGVGQLDLEIVLKPGVLSIFGRKSVSKNFDLVSISDAKVKIKELFDYSLESLYEKYG